MAEIKIEKKKPVWPWVLLIIIIILAAIGYYMYNENKSDDHQDDVNSEEMDGMDVNDMNDSIDFQDAEEFQDSTNVMMQLDESMKDSTRIGSDSTYTKMALLNLAKVVDMKATQFNMETSQAQTDLKMYVDKMEGSLANASKFSKDFKTVSTNIVSVLESIQTKKFPALQKDVADLKQDFGKINTTTTMEKQKNNIQAFFRKANEVLNKMNS